jgi:PhnB protein
MPTDPATPIPAEIANQVMHVNISKNGTMILMGSDMMPGFSPEYIVGTNFEVCIMAETKQEADTYFTNLRQG